MPVENVAKASSAAPAAESHAVENAEEEEEGFEELVFSHDRHALHLNPANTPLSSS